MQRSLTKSAAGLTPLAVGAVTGAGVVSAAPHMAAGIRKERQPHLEAAALENTAKRVGGPLGTVADLGPNQFDFRTQSDRVKFGSAFTPPVPLESRMRSPVPDDVYVAAAHGVLSDREVAHLESFGDELSKGASFVQGLQYGLGTAAASAVGGLAMIGMSHGVQSAYDSLTFEKDLQATLKTRPELSTYPKEQVRLVYQSLRRLSPELAKDPLTAGTYLARQFERRNPSDPHSLPTVELETARTLSQVTGEFGKRRDNVRDALLQANAQGVQAGVGYMQDARQAARQEAMEERRSKGSFELEAEKSRLRDHYEQAKENRGALRDTSKKVRDEQMTNMQAAHGAQVGGLTQKLQEMSDKHDLLHSQNRSLTYQRNAMTSPTPTSYGVPLLAPRPPTLAERAAARAAVATPPVTPPPAAPASGSAAIQAIAAQMRASGPRPPGPRNGKKRK